MSSVKFILINYNITSKFTRASCGDKRKIDYYTNFYFYKSILAS